MFCMALENLKSSSVNEDRCVFVLCMYRLVINDFDKVLKRNCGFFNCTKIKMELKLKHKTEWCNAFVY